MTEPQCGWGPWIEHDGLSVPQEIKAGLIFEARGFGWPDEYGKMFLHWLWWASKDGTQGHGKILEYRTERPRGSEVLRGLVQAAREVEIA